MGTQSSIFSSFQEFPKEANVLINMDKAGIENQRIKKCKIQSMDIVKPFKTYSNRKGQQQ
ncbi:hypothetical protein H5410_060068 [Solanum commersonii]|uniref:Uncharacterized protein n=1 Tax=Solanum commersonii TaxID=4109 RepID=A0A9J5W5F3_SOLCO|nr:hypothetical protein H5410_060068 [Solanum commersonii]